MHFKAECEPVWGHRDWGSLLQGSFNLLSGPLCGLPQVLTRKLGATWEVEESLCLSSGLEESGSY